ncbi:multicopper oxidase domain-containing protein [Methyloraptor flagellatus]|uniref:Multicopper oxidase domain-containing protein n=1 Tax=Methyloraptor flagellatus TaxID=3162530 RepID=A0AAU7XBB9_9HYPH
MTLSIDRRTLLRTALLGAATASIFPLAIPAAQAADTRRLRVVSRTLDIDGRAAKVFGLIGPDERPGLSFDAGATFDVALENQLGEPTLIHWHGLTPPWVQDGVPDMPAPLLGPGETRAYAFPVGAGGTHWMHAHTLQEQNLLAAPLIVRRPDERAADEQEVVVLLHDFAFRTAEEILADLRKPGAGMAHGAMGQGTMDHGGMNHAGMAGHSMASHAMSGHAMAGHDMAGHGAPGQAGPGQAGSGHAGSGHAMAGSATSGAMAMDLNDIDYDAYLANDRTLGDPQVTRVERGARVRLRIINGATSTAFTIDTGALDAVAVAVDGQPVAPLPGRRFGLTMGQRIDLRLAIPKEGGAFPILALREGAVERTGIVLATPGAAVKRVAATGTVKGPVLDLTQEAALKPIAPLAARRPDRRFTVDLTGTMAGYAWSMALAGTTEAALHVRKGERVEITMRNASMMAHPMHLHGHHFQVVAIDGKPVAGAVRDTLLVPPMRSVTVAVDAENPGKWAFHCHHLYHMATGMMGALVYDDLG